MRNRYRRSKLAENLRDEIAPKNILMIGPTGVGKTEVARRMAKLVGAPFIKVEATKFTEVGYVGRDVESMVRDLVETSVRIVKEEMVVKVQDKAEEQANQRLVEILVPSPRSNLDSKSIRDAFGGAQNSNQTSDTQEDVEIEKKRQDVEKACCRAS